MKTVSNPPGPYFLDTSALVKVYLPELESRLVDQLLIGRQDLYISDLAVSEFISAIARRKREGSFETKAAQRLRNKMLEDLKSGMFLLIDLSSPVFREAERILLGLESVALRAADAVHLALAASADVGSIITYDKRMTEAAKSLGFEVWGETRARSRRNQEEV